jgi:hypothetical protein
MLFRFPCRLNRVLAPLALLPALSMAACSRTAKVTQLHSEHRPLLCPLENPLLIAVGIAPRETVRAGRSGATSECFVQRSCARAQAS